MSLKLGINGFGRIGRTVMRVLAQQGHPDLDVVAINDPAPAETLAHLLEFDSLHGRFPTPVELSGKTLRLGATEIRVSNETDPSALNWSDVDLVLECSGQFTHLDRASLHLQNGSDRVLISAPAQGDVKTIVYGVNHHLLSADDLVVSTGSCTTNCLAPIAQVLHDALGIERGMMTTVHTFTNTQPVHDSPHADLYRARAASLSMIPTSTGAAAALGQVLPALDGRITGQAIRVPAASVSCIDLVVNTKNLTTPHEVNAFFIDAAAGSKAQILGTTDRKLVSMDFRQAAQSAVVALDQTRVQDGNMVRVLAWYDNEWGFAHRLLDTASEIAKIQLVAGKP